MGVKFRFKCWPGVRFTVDDLLALCLVILIPVTVIVLVLVSILAALQAPPLPNFDDPIKGFEPRGTELSNLLVTRDNFYNAIKQGHITLLLHTSGRFSNATSEIRSRKELTATVAERSRRSLTKSLDPPLCDGYPYEAMVLVFKTTESKEDLFNAQRLRTMCAMEDDIVRKSSGFTTGCLKVSVGSTRSCCSTWSLGNYVALLNSRESCQDITREDVEEVRSVLKRCSRYFLNQVLKGNCTTYICTESGCNTTIDSSCASMPVECVEHNAVYNILQYLTDNEFMDASNNTFLKFSTTLSPVWYYSSSFFDQVYDESLKEGLPSQGDVQLAGFDFGNLRFDKFSEKLIAEVIFPALAMIVVFVIMWFFLESFILTFCGLFCVIYAIGLSYFFYTKVFGLKFFPFLNLTAFIFLVGIGADDAFVYYDIWKQTKVANPNANVMQLTLKTLHYAALSMLVTSLTTASAFFAGLSSTITAIKCFGIFAGMSILFNYLLMITYFPAAVALHDKWILKYTDGRKHDVITPSETEQREQVTREDDNLSESRKGELIVIDNSLQESRNLCFLQVIDYPCSLLVSANNFFQKVNSKVFEHWLPHVVIKFHWVWIGLFVCLTSGSLCVSFVAPKLNLPQSEDFQVFSSSHPLEQYSLKYKNFFRFKQKDDGMSLILLWGVKPVDNGNYLDADDKGTLEFDEEFGDIFTPEGQKFLQLLCRSAEKQPFFAGFSNIFGKCPIDVLSELCTEGPDPCCGNYKFPFPKAVIKKCILAYATQDKTGLFFDANSGKLLGFIMEMRTNQAFTTAFEPMDIFWKNVNTWIKDEMSKAPSGLKNGFASTWGIRHYALQIGLSEGTYSSMGISVAVSFSIMLLTTLNIFISIYAIVTIIGVIAITIGCLVLAGWELNILESIVMSVAVGLSIDFTVHYGVAYRLSPEKSDRANRVRYSLTHIGSAVTMAAFTTFLTGLMMMPATVLAYFQLGQFLMLVMVFSWLYATFVFLSICAVIGPKGSFGQLSITHLFRKCGLCRVKPDNTEDCPPKPKLYDMTTAGSEANAITTPL